MYRSAACFLGVDDTRFDPDGTMTRAMLTTVLYRLEGEPDGAAGKRFDDVAADAWYARAVAWAAEEQIVLGTDNGFDPEGTITREQLAAMLYRYAAYLGLDTSAQGGLDGFFRRGSCVGMGAPAALLVRGKRYFNRQRRRYS